MPRPEFEMDPDDLRQLDESVEWIYRELPDSEAILSAISRLDHGEDYRYISGYDEPDPVPAQHLDDSLLVTMGVSAVSTVWGGIISNVFSYRGESNWSDLFDAVSVSSGVVFTATSMLYGVRWAIRKYR